MAAEKTMTAPAGEAWTVRRILAWTIEHLSKHGSETPRLDTEILLAHARKCRRIDLYTHYDDPLSDEQRSVMRELVRRRANHEPVAYLVGHREFYSLDFRVTQDVLIPRPDTETLVLELLDTVRELPAPRVLDVGTGTGCIAVAVAVNCPHAHVTAIDISPAALEVAAQNARQHAAGDRIQFLEGDLLAPLADPRAFDVVAANLPYVATHELESLQDDVRKHEPRLALDGGADGLDLVRRLIENLPRHLSPGGTVLLEIDPQQAAATCELLRSQKVFEEPRVINDLGGLARVVVARRPAEPATC